MDGLTFDSGLVIPPEGTYDIVLNDDYAKKRLLVYQIKNNEMAPSLKEGEYAIVKVLPQLKYGADGHDNFCDVITENKIYLCQYGGEGLEFRIINLNHDGIPMIFISEPSYAEKYNYPICLRPNSKFEIYGEVVAKGSLDLKNVNKGNLWLG